MIRDFDDLSNSRTIKIGYGTDKGIENPDVLWTDDKYEIGTTDGGTRSTINGIKVNDPITIKQETDTHQYIDLDKLLVQQAVVVLDNIFVGLVDLDKLLAVPVHQYK